MNVARIGVLLAGLPNTVPGITINRFCSSGLQAVADAAARIPPGRSRRDDRRRHREHERDAQIMGNKISLNPAIFAHDENLAIAYGMGLTAEKVAQQWQISRATRTPSRSSPTGARCGDRRRRLRRTRSRPTW